VLVNFHLLYKIDAEHGVPALYINGAGTGLDNAWEQKSKASEMLEIVKELNQPKLLSVRPSENGA
jgi:hypothetical protein